MADWLSLDQAATLWINHHHNLPLDAILLPVSYFGERGLGWLAIAALMLIWGGRRQRLMTLAFLVALAVTEFVLMPMIREVLPRPRPYMYLPDVRQCGVPWQGTSFPSAHAYLWVYATIFYGAIYPQWRWPLVVGTLLTMYARPYCGMHHVSDALAGAVLGLVIGLPTLMLVKKLGWDVKSRVN